MNTFEAGIISTIPVGGILGGILCKSYGIFAIIGGVIAGMFAGGFAGWLYASLVLVITAVFMGIWHGIRKLPDFDFNDVGNKELVEYMNRNSQHGTIWGVIAGALVSFMTNWWCGLIVAVLLAIMTSTTQVIIMHRGIRKIQAGKCDDKRKSL